MRPFFMRYEASIWDRLLPPDVGVNAGVDLHQFKASVAADLERLLNSRRGLSEEDTESYPLADASVANFGIPDFSSRSLSSGVDRFQICQSLARAIEQFDKRLSAVVVQLRDQRSEVHKMAFDIRAVLHMSNGREQVNFDALFDAAGMLYKVQTLV
ncbi:MAG: type VI secretion system baseplate subunit TssE [Burkholderiales bacterium]|nr:type VI secretion system baseplate subunit TssE [Burkholderiales bacterium]